MHGREDCARNYGGFYLFGGFWNTCELETVPELILLAVTPDAISSSAYCTLLCSIFCMQHISHCIIYINPRRVLLYVIAFCIYIHTFHSAVHCYVLYLHKHTFRTLLYIYINSRHVHCTFGYFTLLLSMQLIFKRWLHLFVISRRVYFWPLRVSYYFWQNRKNNICSPPWKVWPPWAPVNPEQTGSLALSIIWTLN